MAASPLIDSPDAYLQGIRYLQRMELDEQGLAVLPAEIEAASRTALDPSTSLPLWMVQVEGLSRQEPGVEKPATDTFYSTLDILAGLNGQHIPLYFLLVGEPRRVRIFIGTMADDKGSGATIRATFNSYYPGIKFLPEKEPGAATDAEEQERVAGQQRALEQELNGSIRTFINACPYVGVMTGHPAFSSVKDTNTQLDRLIRGMYGTHWCMLVMADPLEDSPLIEMQLEGYREQLRVEEQEGFRDPRRIQGKTLAEFYNSLLGMSGGLISECLMVGGWWVQTYLCAPDQVTYRRIKGLVKGVYSGFVSPIDRIRVLDCFGASAKAASFSPIVVERTPANVFGLKTPARKEFKYHSLQSSSMLSSLIHLPQVEMPGFHLHDSTSFDVFSHVPADVKGIPIGEILEQGQLTGNMYQVPLGELTKHTLLVGITGSGKTNTAKHLLHNLAQEGMPILVIEPAKREYRRIIGSLQPGRSLRVFTVGEEGPNSTPFRLNPFEIRPGVRVQTHIDLLKSVFNAAFGMWSPLPQVLERAIHEVYRSKGWDTIRGVNTRAGYGKDGAGSAEWTALAQPTLSDLFHMVGDLVPRLGYDREVERNLRTALETRLNSLRIGAKGLMLDTHTSLPMEYLLEQTTVLELEGVGDDDEKAFLMGLILVSLYEYYRSADLPSEWKHITVIEEAHRLLSNNQVAADPEASNLKGKAVETFVNMLSEVRAYGEGFLIAEQIPTKLAPDVIKNTGLKIMHRTVSGDDRAAMGSAMNLNNAQMRQVVALGTGEAVVHGGGRYGDDNAILIRVPEVREPDRKAADRSTIRQGWEEFTREHALAGVFLPYPTCQAQCGSLHESCVEMRRTAEDNALFHAFKGYLLSLLAGSFSRDQDEILGLADGLFPALETSMRSCLVGAVPDPDGQKCLLTHALYRFMETRGRQYGWIYADTLARIRELLPALVTLARHEPPGSQPAQGLMSFCREYARLCRLEQGPFPGCALACGESPICLFRPDMEDLLYDRVLDDIFAKVKPGDGEALATVCEMAAARALVFSPEGQMQATRNAAFCFLIQKTHANPANWPPANRKAALALLSDYYGEAYKLVGLITPG